MTQPAPLPRSPRLSHDRAAPVLATLALVGSLFAQDIPLAAFEAISPITVAQATPDGRATGIWGGGRNYKVSFHDGMTYYPHVGPTLPHQPLHWRTVSVQAGEVELLASDVGARVPHFTEQRCDYDLGAITERYELQVGGLEQSFVVATRPAAGDLVIRGVVATPLRIEQRAARHGGLLLRLADDRPLTEYGAAVAIDAAGRRTPITTACEGDTVTLRVPAAVMASATFPLVVDPLLGNVFLEAGGPMVDVDVLHEDLTLPTNLNNWIAYTRTAAAGDDDIWCKRIGGTFQAGLVNIFQDLTLGDATHCQVALAPAANRVAIAFSMDDGPTRTIGIHLHDVADITLKTLTAHPVFAPGASDWRPDLGGRLGPAGSRLLLVFQRENVSPFVNTATSSVYAAVLDATSGGSLLVPPFVVNPHPNFDQERPVCNQASAGAQWLMAFQQSNGNVSNADWNVLAYSIDNLGAVGATPIAVDQNADPLLHSVAPQISGSGGRYLLTYTTRAFELQNPKPLAALGDSLWAQRIDWDAGSGAGTKPHPVVLLQSTTTNDLKAEGSAFDSRSESHWEVASSDAGTGVFWLRRLGYRGQATESAVFLPTTSGGPVAMAVGFDATARRFPMVYGTRSVSGAAGSLQANVANYVALQTPTTIGSACGSGTWAGLSATGERQQIGSEAMPLRLHGVPVDLLSFLIISTAQINLPADPLGAPGCTIVPDLGANLLGLVTANVVGGQSLLTLNLPETMFPMTAYMQWGYLVPGANALGIEASEGIRVTIDF